MGNHAGYTSKPMPLIKALGAEYDGLINISPEQMAILLAGAYIHGCGYCSPGGAPPDDVVNDADIFADNIVRGVLDMANKENA